ncbi:MAG TPA: glycosyltransferase family 2 protein [Spirochaetota bacterium]|nr:glycosyltransferase family 2 protein [Spirochaetota bacterium]
MLYFVIPVFNEELNINELSDSLKKIMPAEAKFFIFVDDCSIDNTIEKIRSCFDPNDTYIITKSENKGPGDSFNLGFEYLLGKNLIDNDLIVTIEADNTSDIDILEKMVANSRLGFDLVLASPYAQGGGFEETTVWRRFLSLIANSLLRFVFDVKVLTLSSFYRVYKPELLKKIKDKHGIVIREPGFICMVEVLIKAIRCKAEIIEVPMKLQSGKRKGKSKMKIFKTGVTYLKFLSWNVNDR